MKGTSIKFTPAEIGEQAAKKELLLNKLVKYLKKLYASEDITLKEKIEILGKLKRELANSLSIREVFYIQKSSELPRNFIKNLF